MKKFFIFFSFFLLIHHYTSCAPARTSIKLELMHNLVELTLQCLEHKHDHELLQKALDTIFAIVTSIEYKAEEKEALIIRIKKLLKTVVHKNNHDRNAWAEIAKALEQKGLKQ